MHSAQPLRGAQCEAHSLAQRRVLSRPAPRTESASRASGARCWLPPSLGSRPAWGAMLRDGARLAPGTFE
eukprot:2028555-Alexandrium_andersonii.AAC.1